MITLIAVTSTIAMMISLLMRMFHLLYFQL